MNTKNDSIIRQFKALSVYYSSKPEYQFKAAAIKRALNLIKNTKLDLTQEENLDKFIQIPGVGKGTIKHIREINRTGKLNLSKEDSKDVKVIQKLTSVYGISDKMAKNLIKDNIRSISSLKANLDKTPGPYTGPKTRDIILGLKHRHKEHIPRSEMQEHEKIIKSIFGSKNAYLLGSYRRGLDFSNDIDVLIKVKDKDFPLVQKMKGSPLYENFAFIKGQKSKYFGFCQLPNHPVRRIDFMLTTKEEFPFALMYFTGNKYFNQRIRKIAKDQGLKLNEYGLFKQSGEPVSYLIKTERDIFRALKIPYVPPNQRNY